MNEYAATYPGDRTEDVGQVVGPNANGYYFVAQTAEYDQSNNTTRIGFLMCSPEQSMECARQDGYVK